MAKPAKKCIFCGGGRITKEHVFARWLRDQFPRDHTTTHDFGTYAWPTKLISKEPRKNVRRKLPGHTGTRKVRVVCEFCNTGWMSALEDRAKPVLLPLIVGNPSNISPEMQKIIATWAAKTVMTADFILPRENSTTQQERIWLKENLAPPENWCVWIAGYSGTSWRDLSLFQSRGVLQPAPVRRPEHQIHHIQATTFGVGHVLFLVINSSWPGVVPVFSSTERRTGLLCLWPPIQRTILWPPARLLNDSQANAVANALTLAGAFNQSLNPGADWTFAI